MENTHSVGDIRLLKGKKEYIKIRNENINNIRCTDDTILMAESVEDLTKLIWTVEEQL